MRINNHYNKDPLAPEKHQVLISKDGIDWEILGSSTEPIEILKLAVQGQQALGFKNAQVAIVTDKQHQVVASFESYREPERDPDSPPTKEWLAVRGRWMDKIFEFLLPARLYAQRNNPKKRSTLARWFRRHKIEISTNEGGAVRIFRNGAVLSEFGC